MKKSKVSIGWLVSVVLILLGCVIFISGCSSGNAPKLTTEYQAVFLDNGQVYFGKAEIGPDYITLRDVFFINSMINKETKEVRNTLVKRGNEWHRPDMMYISNAHVVFIETVSPDSQVTKLIKEQMTQKPAETK